MSQEKPSFLQTLASFRIDGVALDLAAPVEFCSCIRSNHSAERRRGDVRYDVAWVIYTSMHKRTTRSTQFRAMGLHDRCVDSVAKRSIRPPTFLVISISSLVEVSIGPHGLEVA